MILRLRTAIYPVSDLANESLTLAKELKWPQWETHLVIDLELFKTQTSIQKKSN